MKSLLLVFMIAALCIPEKGGFQTSKVLVTAHRGASGYAPENTIASMKTAINMKADYAELDVQETSDGEIILLHDDDLSRTAGCKKNIWETTYDELNMLDAGKWFDEKYKHEPVPKLLDVIDLVRGRMKLNIELKTNGHEKQLAERTVKIVKDADFCDDCCFTSFDYNQIKRVKEIDSSLKCGLIFNVLPTDKDVFKSDFEILSVHYSLVDADFVAKAKTNNKEVHVWTVNDEKEMKRLTQLGVTSIITNYPDKLRLILDK